MQLAKDWRPATARVSIVTFGKNRLAKNAFCCCARMTSTAVWLVVFGPLAGGLFAHIWPVAGLVQAGEEVGQVNDTKVMKAFGGLCGKGPLPNA